MNGLECPECGEGRTRVVDSTPEFARGSVRRRRECLACGARWSTLEIDVDRLALLEDELRKRATGGGGRG